jgi:hypothetical protein
MHFKMRRSDFVRRLVVAVAVVVGATVPASMQSPSTAPPSSPTLAELQWLRDMNTQQEPVYRAIDRCAQLLGNAGEAWQLTPQNVPDCEAGRNAKSPIDAINLKAAPCWLTIGKIIVELNAALAEYRRADELRPRRESTPHFLAGNTRAKAALDMVPGLRACVQQVHDEGDANVRRLRGAISAINRPGVTRGGGSSTPQPLNGRLGQGLRAGDSSDPNVLGVVNDGRNFTLGLADGTQQCLAQFGAIANTVFQLTINNQWGELDRLLGIQRAGGWGPVLKRWVDDALFDAMHSIQEPQGLPRQMTAQQASQLDYQRGKLAGIRLCSFGAVGGAAKLAEAGVGQAGGAVLKRIADAARNSGSSRVRLAGSVADNVVRTVAQRVDRTVTAAEQTQLVQALAELERTEAVNLGTTSAEDALAQNKAMVASILEQLEGDTIYLPGTARGQYAKVTLGKRLGRGAFGWVFEVMENGQPGSQVLKVIGNNWSYLDNQIPRLPPITDALVNNMGGDSLRAQVEGANILQRLGIPTPKISSAHAAANRGEFSFALMERIDTSAPNIDTWAGNKFSETAKRAAIEQLHQRLGGAGYIAADLAPRNVYFVLQDGAVRAGVWDADLIVSMTSGVDEATLARFRGALGGAANGHNLTRKDYLDLFYDIDYSNAPEAMQNIQKIQWGF